MVIELLASFHKPPVKDVILDVEIEKGNDVFGKLTANMTFCFLFFCVCVCAERTNMKYCNERGTLILL